MKNRDGEGLGYGEEEDEDVTTLKKRLGKALAMKGKRMTMGFSEEDPSLICSLNAFTTTFNFSSSRSSSSPTEHTMHIENTM